MTLASNRKPPNSHSKDAAKQSYREARQPKPGRPGVSSLSLPAKEFRPSELQHDFESKSFCLQEDVTRARLLKKTVHQGEWGDAARELASRLQAATRRFPWPTLASSLYWRDLRERIIGNLNALINECEPSRASFATIVRQDWACSPADVDEIDIAAFKSVLRKSLADTGIRIAEGFLIGRFEASFDPEPWCYQFHGHFVATGDYIDAINALKGRKPYQPWEDVLGVADCKRPIMNPDLPIAEAARAFAYALKGFWKLRNVGPAQRLQGDEHTRSLLFLDQHRPEDLFMLMGLHVKGGALSLRV